MKQKVSGEEMIQEVELEEGREHPGQKSWILKFRGVNSVEQVLGQQKASVSQLLALYSSMAHALPIIKYALKGFQCP